jgi:hypothetical protein
MMRILKAYGIPDVIVHAIEDTYHDTKAKVTTPDGETEEFDIYMQGCFKGTLWHRIFLSLCLTTA